MASQFFGFPPRCEGSASAALVVLVCWQDVAVAVVLGGRWAGGSGKQASKQASRQASKASIGLEKISLYPAAPQQPNAGYSDKLH